MRTVKYIMTLATLLAVLSGLFGCEEKVPQIPDKAQPSREETAPEDESPKKKKPQVLDGTGMVYKDEDYRSDYANVLDFDSYDGQPHFAVAFLGYGDRTEFRNTYVEGLFAELGEAAVGQIEHIDYEGDEWYLIVPRYKEPVDIRNLDTDEVYSVYNGMAFTVRCNLSDIHPNIEITTAIGLSGHIFSPQVGGDGRLVKNPDIHDITDYTVLESIEVSENQDDSVHMAWAKIEGIVTETDAGYFLPETICTRAMAVTCLWRMVASPEPAAIDNPFDDVAEGADYYKSVLWAFGSDIVRMNSEGLFKPDHGCTRAEAIRLLWNTAGQPLPENSANPYHDMNDDDNDTLAVLWAVENGIAADNGDGAFGPEEVCSIDEMIEIIYRFINR